jgi:5-methylcytosine-specific restriction enzyme subunit McrC
VHRTVTLFEHRKHTLSIDDAEVLERSCQVVWKSRKTSILFAEEDEDETYSDQAIIRFDRIGNECRITPKGYIGVVVAGSTQYLLLPKIFDGVPQDTISEYLHRMLSYIVELRMSETKDTESDVSACLDLFMELSINAFANKTLSVLADHQYNAYQSVEESITTIRGRIDFANHVRQNVASGRHDRIACSFELYQEDNQLNRIIKYVCKLLMSRTSAFENRRLLSTCLARLEDASNSPCSYRDCFKVKLNAYQQDYRTILDYCKMFLSFRTATVSSGEYGIDHVLIPSAVLFESFVAGYLRNLLSNNCTVEVKKRGFIAQEGGQDIFQYENDFLLRYNDGKPPIVGDAKYKIVDLSDRANKYGISQSDIYQMISYAVCREAENILLVYPGTQATCVETRNLSVKDNRCSRSIRIAICLVPMDIADRTEDSEIIPPWIADLNDVHAETPVQTL